MFGDLDGSCDRSCWLTEDCLVGRPSPATNRAASAVKDHDLDTCFAGYFGDLAQCFVDLPLRRRNTTILVGVRVTDHDLLDVASKFDQLPIGRRGEQFSEHGADIAKIFDHLEQGHEADSGDLSW